jgi:hypothetical protein
LRNRYSRNVIRQAARQFLRNVMLGMMTVMKKLMRASTPNVIVALQAQRI